MPLDPEDGHKERLAEDPRRTDVYRREGLPLPGGIPPGRTHHVTLEVCLTRGRNSKKKKKHMSTTMAAMCKKRERSR